MEASVINLVVRMKMNSGKGTCSLEWWGRESGAEFSKNRILSQKTISNLKQKKESLHFNCQILITQITLYINFCHLKVMALGSFPFTYMYRILPCMTCTYL